MHRATMAALICALLMGCHPTGSIIPDAVSCRRCEIQVEPELRIGTAEGPGSLLGRPMRLVEDSTGRFWVTMLDFGFPYVFDRDGRFLEQFGRVGSGPGEFRMAWVVAALPGDSVLLMAFPSYLVVGPELTVDRVIRGTATSRTGERVISWPDRISAMEMSYTGGAGRVDVVTVDMSGERIVERDTLLTATGALLSSHRLAEPVRPSGTWVAEVARYSLRLYGPDGTVVDSLERRPEWFPTGESPAFGGPGQPPNARVNALRRDERGRLWVYVDRPRSDWRAAWRGISFPTDRGEVRVSSLPPDYELWRTVVEVINPEQRRVVARKELDGQVFGVLAANRVATYVELESGVPVVTIHKLTLREH